MKQYIDVRSVYPTYFNGFLSYRLPFEARGWTIEDAKAYVFEEETRGYTIER